MKEQITKITLDCMNGIRAGVSQVRKDEFAHYIQQLIIAKKGELDLDTIPMPLVSDRVKQGVEAALSSRTSTGVDGGLEWTIVNLGANYNRNNQQGIRIKVDMEFMSIGAPDLERIKTFSVDELEQLMTVVNRTDTENNE